jgi:hypothetical protein
MLALPARLQSERLRCGAGFAESPRGAGQLFSGAAFRAFTAHNGLDTVVRAHECCMRGTRTHFRDCWTVFSQPRYCDRGNAAGTLRLTATGPPEPRMFAASDEDAARLAAHPLAAEDEQAVCDDADVESVVAFENEAEALSEGTVGVGSGVGDKLGATDVEECSSEELARTEQLQVASLSTATASLAMSATESLERAIAGAPGQDST